MSTEVVRILRVLEYVGTRERVEDAIKRRSVKGEVSVKDLTIKEAILGEVPELLCKIEKEKCSQEQNL